MVRAHRLPLRLIRCRFRVRWSCLPPERGSGRRLRVTVEFKTAEVVVDVLTNAAAVDEAESRGHGGDWLGVSGSVQLEAVGDAAAGRDVVTGAPIATGRPDD